MSQEDGRSGEKKEEEQGEERKKERKKGIYEQLLPNGATEKATMSGKRRPTLVLKAKGHVDSTDTTAYKLCSEIGCNAMLSYLITLVRPLRPVAIRVDGHLMVYF